MIQLHRDYPSILAVPEPKPKRRRLPQLNSERVWIYWTLLVTGYCCGRMVF